MRLVFLALSALLLFQITTVQAAILFREDFEDTDFGSRGWYDGPKGDLSASEYVDGSTSSFECRYKQGERVCAGGTPGRHKFDGRETVYLSYYVKYSTNWEGSNKPYHPHEFHFITNVDTDYIGPARTHLSTYIEQNEGVPRLALQDSLNVDSNCILRNDDKFIGCGGSFDDYQFTEQRSVASCNGIIGGFDQRDCFSSGSGWYSSRGWSADKTYFSDSPGKYYKNDWHFVEAMFSMNSIQNSKGVPDGKIRYWYDCEELISYDNILLRTAEHPNMKFDQFLVAPYIGDGSPVEQVMWIDNLVVSDERISVCSDNPPDCIQGDLNCDGAVDILDLVLAAQDFGKTSGFDPRADANSDGKVDIFDLVLVAQNFGKTP
jgi:hypothetical protein